MKVLFLSAALVLLDQVTKLLVKGATIPFLGVAWEGMHYGSSIPVLGDFFRLTYIENPGMAFGINFGGKPLFAFISLAASVAIVVYIYKARSEPLSFRLPLAMILGGAVGNMIDRMFYGVLYGEAPLFYGKVVDFFDVDFPDIDLLGYQLTRWPVFNIADASVTVGVILLLLLSKRTSEDPAAKASPGTNQSITGNPPSA